jgi:hypothetical protein
MSTAGTQPQPYDKRWSSDDDNILSDPPANRRKPRTYSTADGGKNDPPRYSLDFCEYLHRKFDAILADIHAGELRA